MYIQDVNLVQITSLTLAFNMRDDLDFLAGGGEMGALIRSHNWASSPLGIPATWPQSLRSTLSACLNSPMLGAILWGPELYFFYNDAYVPSVADRHPAALGRPVAEVWGNAWQRVSPPFYRALLSGEGFSQRNVELPLVRRGKIEVTYWDFTAAPIRGEEGTIAGLLNQGVEITDQVLAERARDDAVAKLQLLNATLASQVVEQNRELTQLWRTSRDPFVICDSTGRWVRASPAWTSILGWTESELLGRTSHWMEHPDDQQKTRDKVADVSRGEATLEFENRFRDRNGNFHTFSWTAVAEEELLYCVARDITKERALAQERVQLEEQLRQAQKMEAVGQLTGGLAHDFNNLLTAITGSLEMLSIRVQQGRIGEVDRYVHASQGAAKRATALTHRLLAFSRRQTLDPKPTDVNRLVVGMSELLQRTIGPAIELENVAAGGLWTTILDPGQLENALLNLCINARDAMPDGGKLTIETGNKWFDERTALERDLSPGQYVSVCVSDTGTGMTPEIIARAIDPFFTTKPIGMGTGLGLSMVYGFARQSGGQVRIYSEIDKGTMVCLYFPRHAGSNEVVEQEATATGVISPDLTESVLVVDDEPTVRMLVVDVLHDMGCLALEAQDGAGGMKILSSGAKIDLLITDVGLPGGMNGRQLADAARQERPDLKVLFITGYAENAVLSHGHLAHGMHVLTKPFTIENLMRRVKQLVG